MLGATLGLSGATPLSPENASAEPESQTSVSAQLDAEEWHDATTAAVTGVDGRTLEVCIAAPSQGVRLRSGEETGIEIAGATHRLARGGTVQVSL